MGFQPEQIQQAQPVNPLAAAAQAMQVEGGMLQNRLARRQLAQQPQPQAWNAQQINLMRDVTGKLSAEYETYKDRPDAAQLWQQRSQGAMQMMGQMGVDTSKMNLTPDTARQFAADAAQRMTPTAEKAKTVQSSKILPGGLVQLVYTDGSTDIKPPQEAQAELVRAAETRGAELQGLRAGERGEAKQATKAAAGAYKSLSTVRKSIINMDEGIRLLRVEGAKTGPVQSMLPSIRASSIRLKNLKGRMGLDVIGSVTFGALSEAELKFALDVALPDTLDPEELAKWMEEKRTSQVKLSGVLEDASVFLGTPGNTVADWIEKNKGTQAAAPAAPATAPVFLGFE